MCDIAPRHDIFHLRMVKREGHMLFVPHWDLTSEGHMRVIRKHKGFQQTSCPHCGNVFYLEVRPRENDKLTVLCPDCKQDMSIKVHEGILCFAQKLPQKIDNSLANFARNEPENQRF